MQAYRVKLQEGHTAEANQVSKDGYLCDEHGEPYLYTAKNAKSKGEWFGGKREKFGKKYVTSRVQIIQFDEISFEPKTLQLLKLVAVYSNTGGIGHFMCYANVFDELLVAMNTPEDIQDELKALAYICQHYDYVQVLKHY